MSVDDVQREQERNAKARFLDRNALNLVGLRRTKQSIDGTDPTFA